MTAIIPDDDEAPEVPAVCVGCQREVDELDEFGQCVDCSPTLDAPIPLCHECGNDEGPFDGLCLDCLEKSLVGVDSHIDDEAEDTPW
jgi:predicted amidophosphoribosyltransferase